MLVHLVVAANATSSLNRLTATENSSTIGNLRYLVCKAKTVM